MAGTGITHGATEWRCIGMSTGLDWRGSSVHGIGALASLRKFQPVLAMVEEATEGTLHNLSSKHLFCFEGSKTTLHKWWLPRSMHMATWCVDMYIDLYVDMCIDLHVDMCNKTCM